nr:unnamed protein product [Digitaria exilis]
MAVAAPAPAPNPRRTILEVEVFVAGATTLLVLQLIFGLCKRRSSSIWIQGAVWLAYTLSFPLVTYTFGLMQSSPAKSQLYPSPGAPAVTACDLDETKQWKKQLFELGQQYVYSGIIFLLLHPSQLSILNELIWNPKKLDPILEYCYMLLAAITITNLFRVVACWMATFTYPSKVVADYMRDQNISGGRQVVQQQGSDQSDRAIRMLGGRYLIAASFRSTTQGHLINGQASLRRNGVSIGIQTLMRNREDRDLAETMLIWHIATNYCEIAEPPNNSDPDELKQHYRKVATSLSRYSAYLMASVPELLPGYPADTSYTFDKVMQEATEALYPGQMDDIRGREKADKDMLDKIMVDGRPRSPDEENHSDTIFVKGLKLGKELKDKIQDGVLRWKVMAEFWAEMILYVAPSDNVRGHVEQLAKGGEFITHVWALLSHAGILTRHPRQ